MKKLKKSPLVAFLGYLSLSTSVLAMENDDRSAIGNNKYGRYHYNCAVDQLGDLAPLSQRPNYATPLQGTLCPSESVSSSKSSSESESEDDSVDTSTSGCRYSLQYNNILNQLAVWPGNFTGSVDYGVVQEGSSNVSWVPGTMTIQRDQILWSPNSNRTLVPMGKEATAPLSFGHARKVRTDSKTEFSLLASLTGETLKESRKGKRVADRFRVSESVEPWIKAINNYLAQVSNWENLYQLGSDFVSKATTFGRMIIEEYYLPDCRKAIKKSSSGGIAGGEKFIIHDILFKFSIDPKVGPREWLYGENKPNNTKAFKSFNHELLGANAVSSYGAWLKTPLMAIIDFRGRRLMAASLLPINDSTLVYGSKDGCQNVFATDAVANEKMMQMGKDLNLQPHMVNGELMALCGDLEVHRSESGYYALDPARVFPPAAPHITPNSIWYQKLNPAFVRMYKTPLDADGFTGFQEDGEDANLNNINLMLATQHLHEQILPRFVKDLMILPVPETFLGEGKYSRAGGGDTKDFLISRLHEAGLNVRHLGRVWALLEEAQKSVMSNYVLNFMIARVLKNHTRTVFREEMTQENHYRYFITDMMNKLTQLNTETRLFWASEMPTLLKDQFDIEVPGLIDRLHQGYLLNTFCRSMGVVLKSHPVYEKKMSFEFAPSDIIDFQPVIKYLNMIDLATGMANYFKGMALIPTTKNKTTSFQISRLGLDHLIEAKNKLMSCRLTWNNQNHPVLPNHLDRLLMTLEDLIQKSNSPLRQAKLGLMKLKGIGGERQDAKDAVRLFKLSAKQQDPMGLSYLGLMQFKGMGGEKKNEKEAIRSFTQAAKLNDPMGQAYLGIMNFKGIGGLKKNEKEAVRLYEAAAEQHDPFGLVLLGEMNEKGRGGVKQNFKEAVRLYQEAADQSDPSGQSFLGVMTLRGLGGIRQNDKEAVTLFKLAADQNDGLGMCYLGVMNSQGRGGLTQDEREAARLYRLAAEEGHPRGQAFLGSLSAKGIGGERQDDVEARRLYEEAADQDDPIGQVFLGCMHKQGRGGLRQDDAEAVRLFQLSADQAEPFGEASLGSMYLNGRGGLRQDDNEARRWFEAASFKGDEVGHTYLGLMHLEGRGGLKRDEKEALRLFQIAAKQESSLGYAYLGQMYEEGLGGVKQDEKEAVRLYEIAHRRGSSTGAAYLAKMYEEGRGGLRKDAREAVRLYEIAVANRSATAQVRLGTLYEKGSCGLKQNTEEAVRLYTLAAEQGNAAAKLHLGRLGR